MDNSAEAHDSESHQVEDNAGQCDDDEQRYMVTLDCGTRYQLDGDQYFRDPYPLFSHMLERGPIHPVYFHISQLAPVPGWLVTGYEAACKILRSPQMRKDHKRGNQRWQKRASIMPEPAHSQLQVHLLHRDPPDHTIMRKLISPFFTPAAVEKIRPQIVDIIERRIQALPDGRCDFVDDFAFDMALEVLSLAIGLPDHFRIKFRRSWAGLVRPLPPDHPGRKMYLARIDELTVFLAEVVEYFIQVNNEEPENIALSAIATVVDAATQGKINNNERDSLVFQLLVAGAEPVTGQLTMCLFSLLTHPKEFSWLIEDKDTIAEKLPLAVEELIRYESTFFMTTWRFFQEDTRMGDYDVPWGDSVIISVGAANRDPNQFTDPDNLNLQRSPNKHIAFGQGIHFCPAAALARAEITIALEKLFTHIYDIELDCELEELKFVINPLSRTAEHLPIRYRKI